MKTFLIALLTLVLEKFFSPNFLSKYFMRIFFFLSFSCLWHVQIEKLFNVEVYYSKKVTWFWETFFFLRFGKKRFHIKAYFQCFPIQWHQFHSTALKGQSLGLQLYVDDSIFQYKSINFVYLENSGKDSLLQPWYGSQFCAFCKIGVCLLCLLENQFHQRTTNKNIFPQIEPQCMETHHVYRFVSPKHK